MRCYVRCYVRCCVRAGCLTPSSHTGHARCSVDWLGFSLDAINGGFHGTPTVSIVHSGLRCVRRRLRSLRDGLPVRERCRQDDRMHPAGYGLRGHLPRRVRHHGARQQFRAGGVRLVRLDLRCLRPRVRETFARALQAVRATMPEVRAGMRSDGLVSASRRFPSTPTERRSRQLPGVDDKSHANPHANEYAGPPAVDKRETSQEDQ